MLEFIYLLILVAAISAVYAGTRYEAMDAILVHWVKTAMWFGGALLVVHVLLYGISLWAG